MTTLEIALTAICLALYMAGGASFELLRFMLENEGGELEKNPYKREQFFSSKWMVAPLWPILILIVIWTGVDDEAEEQGVK